MTFDPTKHLTSLKGKDYLEVKWRLVWARDVAPDLIIETEHIEITDQRAIFKARVSYTRGDEGNETAVWATGYGSETPKDFGDYIEKAETKALGRALGALGFGTQFTDDFDEGTDNPVDAPLAKPQPASAKPAQQTATNNAPIDVDTARMKRLHAVADKRGLGHDEVHAIVVGRGKASTKDLTAQEMDTFTNWLEKVSPPALQVAIDSGRETANAK